MLRMPRLFLVLLAVGATVSIAACASSGFSPLAVTRDANAVSGCEKVADVQAEPSRFDDTDAQTLLERKARDKGANTVLITANDATAGTAYRCSMPSVTSSSSGASSR